MSDEQWLLDHPVLRVAEIDVTTPAGPRRFIRMHLVDWVNIVAVTPTGEVVLVEQPRTGSMTTTLEIPGGCIDPGEDPETAARRELLEETGYRAETLVSLGWVWSNPALQDNRTHMFLAKPAVDTGASHPDPEEDIIVRRLPVDQVIANLDAGTIDHALAVAALERALRRDLL